jgi:hypothetical protein
MGDIFTKLKASLLLNYSLPTTKHGRYTILHHSTHNVTHPTTRHPTQFRSGIIVTLPITHQVGSIQRQSHSAQQQPSKVEFQ